ncbi:MAG: dockerin type I domain-containing protein [Planctomycetota bacterium]|nr:dockerin type I domain-containing protein [Planctomycetota bacterium]
MQAEYSTPFGPQQELATETSSAPQQDTPPVAAETIAAEVSTAGQYDMNHDGFVSPIDVLLLINHEHDAADAALPVTETINALDVNGDGQTSDRDVRQLIGYVEQMNDLHQRFDTAALAVSVASMQAVPPADSATSEVDGTASAAKQAVGGISLIQPEGEASQEQCDTWERRSPISIAIGSGVFLEENRIGSSKAEALAWASV